MTTPDIAPAAALEPKTKISGKILKATLAGALVDIGQPIPGVLHISQMSEKAINKVEDVAQVGDTVEVWVRRVRKDRIELTMIEPLAYEWKELEPEMVVKGKVVRIESYGAFVEIGAERPGLVHVSELTHRFVKTPNEVLKEGDEIEAKVLEVNRKKKQIRLSVKALEPVEEKVMPEFSERPEREDRKRNKRNRKEKEHKEEMAELNDEPKEEEQTAMQVAWQQAMERSGRDKDFKTRRFKATSDEHEKIFNRTLEKRLPTGG